MALTYEQFERIAAACGLGAVAAQDLKDFYDQSVGADITAVVAGAGMTGGGTSGAVTLNVIAGANIAVAADAVALATNVDVAGTLDVTGAAVLDSTLAVAGNTTLGNASTDETIVVGNERVRPSMTAGNVAGTDVALSVEDQTAFASGVGGGVRFKGFTDAVPNSSTLATVRALKANGTSANTQADLVFSTNTGSAVTEKLRLTAAGATVMAGALDHDGSTAGFFGMPPTTKPTVAGTIITATSGTGVRSLLDALDALGLINDTTSDI